jgi:hypothetical protein
MEKKTEELGMTQLAWQLFAEAAEHEPTPEEEAELILFEKAALRASRREKRLRDCGSWAYWFDPHTGQRSGYLMYCDIFRECSRCLLRRATKEYEWMKKAVLAKDINVVKIEDKRTASNLVRGVHKSKYARYPLEDGTELVFIDANEKEIGEKAELEWIMKQDWSEIVSTPKGRNKSGTIHVPASPEDEEPFTIIKAKQFVTDAPVEQVEQAAEEVIAETDYMRPENPKDVLLYLNRRLSMTIRKLKAQGFDCRVYQKKLKVIHSRIDWSGEMPDFSVKANFSDSSNLTVNTENLTSGGGEIEDRLSPDGLG